LRSIALGEIGIIGRRVKEGYKFFLIHVPEFQPERTHLDLVLIEETDGMPHVALQLTDAVTADAA
jgi:hypothetical protein